MFLIGVGPTCVSAGSVVCVVDRTSLAGAQLAIGPAYCELDKRTEEDSVCCTDLRVV